MKKNLFVSAVIVFMAGCLFNANAQTTDDDFITGKAQVVQTLKVLKQVNLDFGIVAQGANKTIGLNNDMTGGPNLGTQTTGRFLVTAAPSTNVDITFFTPTNLSSGANTLSIEDYTYGWHTSNTFTGGTTFTGGSTDITFPENLAESLNAIYVFIGATVKPAVSQVVGNYEAEITLTATYN
jgi:hypothetical protein